MSTSSISSTPTPTRHFRLLAHAFLIISTNSLTLCLLYTLHISPSKQHFGFRSKLAILQIAWLISSGLVLMVSLCYLISSYYRGHQRRMVAAAAARHDAEIGVREPRGRGGGSGRRGETVLKVGPPYELQPRPARASTRALSLARGGGRNPLGLAPVLEGGSMDVVREKERRHGPVPPLQKPLPPDPPADDDDDEEEEEEGGGEEEGEEEEGEGRAELPMVNNLFRIPRRPLAGPSPGPAVYPSYNTPASAILPFGQANVNSAGGAPGVRVGEQGGAVDGENDSEGLGSQPLYANNELRDFINRYL